MPMLRGEAAVGEGSDGVPATGAEISEREGCERKILTQIQPSDSPLLHEWLAIAARAKEIIKLLRQEALEGKVAA
jgi:hypothetical protein